MIMKDPKDNRLFKFINECNTNWLQGRLIELYIRFEFSEEEFDEINKWLQFGIENKVYNAVPRLCQGNEVKDLAPHLIKKFEYLFSTIQQFQWITDSIKLILLGKYKEAKEILDKV